jgi:hypothetical protein
MVVTVVQAQEDVLTVMYTAVVVPIVVLRAVLRAVLP